MGEVGIGIISFEGQIHQASLGTSSLAGGNGCNVYYFAGCGKFVLDGRGLKVAMLSSYSIGEAAKAGSDPVCRR